MALSIKKKLSKIENTLLMIEYFDEIQSMDFSETDINILENKIINNPIIMPNTNYWEYIYGMQSLRKIPFHECFHHHELLELWEEIAKEDWRYK